MNLRSFGEATAKIEVAVPAAPKTEQSWAEEVSVQLRKGLRYYKIKAEVRIINVSGKDALEVNFLSKKDYENIKDLFYQDPGDNPSYMDVKIYPLVMGKPVVEPAAKGGVGGRSGLSVTPKSFEGFNGCYQKALQYVSPPPGAAKLCQGAVDTTPVDCYVNAYQVPGVGPSVAFSICTRSSSLTGPLDCFQMLKSSLGYSTSAALCRGSIDTVETLNCYNQALAANMGPGDAAVACSR